MASLTPAEIVHRGHEIGSIAAGKFADLLVIDDQVNVRATYIGGRRADLIR
jgi:N-acetylglucosamine-6-phosphate deacetylase